MNSASYLKALISRWGVELSLAALLALAICLFQDTKIFTPSTEASMTPLSEESRQDLKDLVDIVEHAKTHQREYVKTHSQESLAAYNQDVTSVNQKMAHLSHAVRENADQQMPIHQFNQLVASQFEELSRGLSSGKIPREPSNMGKLYQMADELFRLYRLIVYVHALIRRGHVAGAPK